MLDAVYIDSSFNPQHNSAGKLSLSHLTMNRWLADQEPWLDKGTEALTYRCLLRDTTAGIAVPRPLMGTGWDCAVQRTWVAVAMGGDKRLD